MVAWQTGWNSSLCDGCGDGHTKARRKESVKLNFIGEVEESFSNFQCAPTTVAAGLCFMCATAASWRVKWPYESPESCSLFFRHLSRSGKEFGVGEGRPCKGEYFHLLIDFWLISHLTLVVVLFIASYRKGANFRWWFIFGICWMKMRMYLLYCRQRNQWRKFRLNHLW